MPQITVLLLFFSIFAGMIRLLATYVFLAFLSTSALAQIPLQANAGTSKNICPGKTMQLGGGPTATGGVQPYTYKWEPANGLSSTSNANPTASNITETITYYVTVTDKAGNTSISFMTFYVDPINTFNAGIDTGYCLGQQPGIRIGAPNNNNTNHIFTWQPSTGLDDASAANPIASNTVTTQYVLTVTNNGVCPEKRSTVTVIPFPKPVVDASPDTVIDEGNTITLNARGSYINFWQPNYNLKYGNSVNPDVWPVTTTTYTLFVEDVHHCINSDTVRVEVINGDKLFFYSAFTPNGDGENDFFYIGNLEKFPDNNLKIYNRYGKIIFSATNYNNDWNGTYLGNEIPTGTYFYIFTDGVDKKYKGTVTILR